MFTGCSRPIGLFKVGIIFLISMSYLLVILLNYIAGVEYGQVPCVLNLFWFREDIAMKLFCMADRVYECIPPFFG